MSWDLVDRALCRDYTSGEDVLVAFVHWRCLGSKLKCVGIGDDFKFTADETLSELLPRGWNDIKERDSPNSWQELSRISLPVSTTRLFSG
jgi:hypothetical protein